MFGYIWGRLVQACITLLLLTVVIFMLTRLSGDPALLMLPPGSTQQEVQQLSHSLGMDQPVAVQYWRFVSKAARGDFGISLHWNQPALPLVLQSLPASLELGGAAIFLTLLVSLPIGILSAAQPGGWVDRFGKTIAVLGQSMPVFWLGIMLIVLFAVKLRWLPTSGRGGLNYLVLPAVTLAWYFIAVLTRLTRSAMLDVLDAEYIKLAQIKGVPPLFIICKHALRNASIPIVTLAGVEFVDMVTGAIVTETVFAWPGVGTLIINAVFARDFPLIQAAVFVIAFMFIMLNLGIDLLYSVLDPRIRVTA